MMALLKACAECGVLSAATYCTYCKPKPESVTKGKTAQRGYGARWDRLSKRARRLQPWCLDCQSTEDLTADHLPIAWERQAKGLSVRLCDVEVVCRSCNGKRGAARGDRLGTTESIPWGVGAMAPAHDPRGQDQCPSLIENGSQQGGLPC